MMTVWYCQVQSKVHGPYSAQQIKHLVDRKKLKPGDPVRKESDGPWRLAANVKGLFSPAELAEFEADSMAVMAASANLQAMQSSTPVSLAAPDSDISQIDSQVPATRATSQASASDHESAGELRTYNVFRYTVMLFCIVIIGFLSVGLFNRVKQELKESKEQKVAQADPVDRQPIEAPSQRRRASELVLPASTSTVTDSSTAEVRSSVDTSSDPEADIPIQTSTQPIQPTDAPVAALPMLAVETPPVSSQPVGAQKADLEFAVLKAVMDSVVFLELKLSPNDIRGGHGVLLYPSGLILSNHPAIKNSQEINVTFSDGAIARVLEVENKIPQVHLSFLRVDASLVSHRPMVKLAEQMPQPQDSVIRLKRQGKRAEQWESELLSINRVDSAGAFKASSFPQGLKVFNLSRELESYHHGCPVFNLRAEMIGLPYFSNTNTTRDNVVMCATEIAQRVSKASPLPGAKFVTISQEAAVADTAVATTAPGGAANSFDAENSITTSATVVTLNPQQRLDVMQRLKTQSKAIVTSFNEVQQEGADYEKELTDTKIRFNLLSQQAAELKVRGENLFTLSQALQRQINQEKDPLQRQGLRQQLIMLELRFKEVKTAFDNCVKEGTQVEQNLAELNKKIAAALKKRNELQAQGDKLRSEWLVQADPHAWLPLEDHQTAMQTYDQWVKDDSQFAGVYLARGFARLHLGQIEQAVEDFQLAVEKDPGGESISSTALGCALSRAGKAKEAQSEFGRAIAKDKKLGFAYLFRGEHLRRQGKCKAAEDDFETAARLDEENPEAFRQLAWLQATCTESGVRNGRKAVEHAEQALSLWEGPPHWRLLLTLAAAYAESGDFEKSTDFARQAKAAAPAQMPDELQQQLAQLEKKEALRLE